MSFKKIKSGLLSVIIAVFGILFILWLNVEVAILYGVNISKMNNQDQLCPVIFTIGKWHKIIALGFALLGILLGIKSFRTQKKFAILGIILSVVLMILSFIPIWTYFL